MNTSKSNFHAFGPCHSALLTTMASKVLAIVTHNIQTSIFHIDTLLIICQEIVLLVTIAQTVLKYWIFYHLKVLESSTKQKKLTIS